MYIDKECNIGARVEMDGDGDGKVESRTEAMDDAPSSGDPKVQEKKEKKEEKQNVNKMSKEGEGEEGTVAGAGDVAAEDCFKVPSGIAIPFKKPLFSKVPKKSAKPEEKPELLREAEEENPTADGKESSTPHQPKQVVKSPSQQLVEKSIPLPYKEPSWSGLPGSSYSFEVLKNGTIVETVPLAKPFVVIGRLPQCDIVMEHPSLSRFHCVIQYRAEQSSDNNDDNSSKGFYAYDLGSTHGSFHNKHRMKPHTYYRLRVGHMVKFGASSRMLILQGPDEDQEPESELTVTELKAEAAIRAEKLRRLETGEMEEEDRDRRLEGESTEGNARKTEEESDGIDWGMGEDAEEEDDDEGEDGGVNPFATLNEELYLNDPKKTLRGWFEREGYDLPEYVAEDVSPGVYKCRVELPIPGPAGGPQVAIVEHRGRKKAAVIQCALEACRILDRRGVLRQARHESHEKKRKDWAKDDYYDSDEDDFLDRTGDVQRKRLRRMKTASSGRGSDPNVQTYDSLIVKYNEVIEELSTLEKKLAEAERVKREAETRTEEEDDLDSFMRNLKKQVPDKHKRVNWKLRTVELRKEELRLRRLANVAKPFDKPELRPYVSEFDSQPNLPAKHPFIRRPDPSRHPLAPTRTKEFTPMVHKAFQEEEPEKKIKLRRLDDDDKEDRLVPIPYKTTKPKFPSKPSMQKSILKQVPTRPAVNVASITSLSEKVASKPMPSEATVGPMPSEATVGPMPSEATVGGDDVAVGVKPLPLNAQADKNSRGSSSSPSVAMETAGSATGVGSPMEHCDTERKETDSERTPEETPRTTEEDHHTFGGQKKKCHVIGPTLPSPRQLEEFLKVSSQGAPKAKKKSGKKSASTDDADITRYDTWMPPSNQSGDGRTSLNEKFGY